MRPRKNLTGCSTSSHRHRRRAARRASATDLRLLVVGAISALAFVFTSAAFLAGCDPLGESPSRPVDTGPPTVIPADRVSQR